MLNIFLNPHINTGINLTTRHIQPDEPQRIDVLWNSKIFSMVLEESEPKVEIWSIDKNEEPDKKLSSILLFVGAPLCCDPKYFLPKIQ